ncbi:glycine cleavage system protein R [Auraticoccus monumenti]|uniref:Glycine cleavage system transcriptional repressor n=1 Tax=Auraticoccus monumenti TaxID=675864 RepID=A0A1G7BMG8_9ACTN|nr:ACT domain-containing protein [Auraticoccus monumenti]SDE28122.1 glycine cleavage system transcriptional repressor [Auraticoccus monumenti]
MSTPGPAPAEADVIAVTVIGADRPGIVAEVTGALAGVEGNLEDSTMTLLRGQFAMVVLVRSRAGVPAVQEALSPLASDGRLAVDVRPVAGPPTPGSESLRGGTYVVHVNGADRPGIVAALTAVLARHQVNIVDLGTRLAGGLYVLTAEVAVGEDVDLDAVRAELEQAAAAVGVHVRLMPVETDEL